MKTYIKYVNQVKELFNNYREDFKYAITKKNEQKA